MVCGCGPAKMIVEQQRDSVIIHVRDSIRFRDSLILVPVPEGSDKANLPATDTSYLSTGIAESTAYVKDGQLHHSLRNKETLLPVPVKLPSVIRQEYAYALRDRKVVEVVEVERELSGWQRTLQILGGGLLAAVAAWLLLKLGKHFIL